MTLPKPRYRVSRDEVCVVWINTTVVAPAQSREIGRWCSEHGYRCETRFLKYLGDPLITFAEARRMCRSRYMVLVALIPLRAAMELVKLCNTTGVCEVWQPKSEIVKVCRSYEECRDVAREIGDRAIVVRKGRRFIVRRFTKFVRIKSATVEEEDVQ